MRIIYSCFILLSSFYSLAQEVKPEVKPLVKIDSLYREDQFYFSITYNMFTDIPQQFKQNKFSLGLSGGFLRDMPLNKNRNIAIATGLGLSYQNYFQNLTISKDASGTIAYGVSDYGQFVSNRYRQYTVELPIEFRWRNSTFESYKFWRIYGGMKLSYIFSNTSILDDGIQTFRINNNKDINKFQYGPYISAGYNTWNLYIYYGLSPLFKSAATVNGDKLSLKTLNAGLIFYIL
ncbi:porin family protein [Flavobacterium hungaricum]|uniref:PorT family protein n=1 Tax=Flavobacterium hungaricum TaxID=2082725 RepID=A0ABR9TII4_9FLAO|nr:porin family protein [Flavobacterium hungaricum]MBE8725165.1 PorT family protein [Flavobacterium hungaricum]